MKGKRLNVRVLFALVASVFIWSEVLRFVTSAGSQSSGLAATLAPNHLPNVADATSFQHVKYDAELLVLVIASENSVYDMNWAVWERVAANSPCNVQVYLIISDMESTAEKPVIDEAKNIIRVPQPETYIPGILKKTIDAMELVLGDKHRTFKYILRTNMSSLWYWPRVMAVLKALPTANAYAGIYVPFVNERYELLQTGFISGAGIILSRDVAQLLVDHSAELHWHLIDDVAIGLFLIDSKIDCIKLPDESRCDFVSDTLPAPLLTSGMTCHHYRIKSETDRLLYDGYIFSRLYHELYPRLERVGRCDQKSDAV